MSGKLLDVISNLFDSTFFLVCNFRFRRIILVERMIEPNSGTKHQDSRAFQICKRDSKLLPISATLISSFFLSSRLFTFSLTSLYSSYYSLFFYILSSSLSSPNQLAAASPAPNPSCDPPLQYSSPISAEASFCIAIKVHGVSSPASSRLLPASLDRNFRRHLLMS